MRASSLSMSQPSPPSSTSNKGLPSRSSSLSRGMGRLRIRDSITSAATATTTSAASALHTRASSLSSVSSSSSRSGSLSASSLASSGATASFGSALPRKSSLTGASHSASPITRSASNSLSATVSPAVSNGTRRRLSVLENPSIKERDEQKTVPSSSSSSLSTSSSSTSKTVMRRRLSVMNGNDGSHLDGPADPKQPREARLRSAKSPTASSTSSTVLPSLARKSLSLASTAAAPSSSVPSTSVVASSSPTSSTHHARAFSHYASLSKVGHIPYNANKVNQDRAVEVVRFNGSDLQALFAVFDGHGSLGHEVSTFLTHEVPRQLTKQCAAAMDKGGDIHGALVKALMEANVALVQTSRIDCTFSGSTGIVCWMSGRRLFTLNVGDSRAVLGKRHRSPSSSPAYTYTAHALSNDQKPDRPDERRRIIDAHGRVECCKGPRGEDIGPARVWLAIQDVPGLAMSRSFGDLIAASVGVVARPEVDEREVGDDDAFVVLGSDGVWEFMSNEEVVELVGRVGGAAGERAEEAARAVVEEATRRWNREEEVVDDITCIIVFI